MPEKELEKELEKKYYIQELQKFEELLQSYFEDKAPEIPFASVCLEFQSLLGELAFFPEKLGKENLEHLERPLRLLETLESKLSARMNEWVLMRSFTG